ncbi:L-2-hydroxyglutarate dehydrogenase, mitochondrial isoform X2 [Mercurialis annua]|uniref:L-2-hydroxyglutarate dehydrogenase, mitochondrial isoform X2 n=1 Tax=Mercurialis annua TaxID=3986 RepID=UPI00215E0AF8|nr:L-2-hydroxyglutarate dehydrogenase, mitochondrial isoform X2 [Mercurialis annua]
MLKQTIRRFIRRSELEAAREKVECVVIGAGIVGIAIARELSLRGKQVLVLESAKSFGSGSSSRNSQVIHAGIYYPPSSFKALFCVQGRNLLYQYCSRNGIPHKQTGKLIVATSPCEIPKLHTLMDRAARNGVSGLRMLDGFEAMRLEPQLRCLQALFSPLSGIVDAHSLMLSLLGEAESYKTTLSCNTTVVGGHLEDNRLHLHVMGTRDFEHWDGNSILQPDLILIPDLVINSAGLSAIQLTSRFDGFPKSLIPPPHYARGCYFTLPNAVPPPFQHLIYPIPEDGGLGVHLTLDLDGQVKFGPDVHWIPGVDDKSSFLDRYDYSVMASRAERFYPEISKYYPNLKDGILEPGYAGIRPKISGPGQDPMDFVIQGWLGPLSLAVCSKPQWS